MAIKVITETHADGVSEHVVTAEALRKEGFDIRPLEERIRDAIAGPNSEGLNRSDYLDLDDIDEITAAVLEVVKA